MNARESRVELDLHQHHALALALQRPEAWPEPQHDFDTVETHISTLVRGERLVAKLKKPLALPFLDFSTLERRRRACEEELRINRRTAAGLYLGVLPVTGSLSAPVLGGEGPVLDWAVLMQRFDDGQRLDRLADTDALTDDLVDALAQALASLHDTGAPVSCVPSESQPPWGDPQSALERARDNVAALRLAGPVPLDVGLLDEIAHWTDARHAVLREAMAQRCVGGRVREGHGDLHLANIVLHDGRPVLFDALEFDPALRHLDVVDDLAFLLMDLLDRGRARAAWRLASGWLACTGDTAGLPPLRWYMAYRALVRAKVAWIRARQADAPAAEREAAAAETLRRMRLAAVLARLRPPPGQTRVPQPMLVLTCGLSGSGKSSAALSLVASLGEHRGGALRLRSDVERKRLHGLPPTFRPSDPARLYNAEVNRAVQQRLLAGARDALEGDLSVVVDAAFLRRHERDAMRSLARDLGVPCALVECTAPQAVLQARIEARRRADTDASDATLDVLALQQRIREPVAKDEWAGPGTLRSTLDTDAPPATVAARVEALVASWA